MPSYAGLGTSSPLTNTSRSQGRTIALSVASGQPYYKPSFGYVGFDATVRAAEVAYGQAGISAKDVDFAEGHEETGDQADSRSTRQSPARGSKLSGACGDELGCPAADIAANQRFDGGDPLGIIFR